MAELAEVVGGDLDEVVRFWGPTEGGNFEGANILHVRRRGALRPPAVERARARLFAVREGRVRPGLDDKVLLGWNAMFLDSLARSAAAMGREDWMSAARINAGFLLRSLRREDGRLLRSWQDGRARHLAYAEDYAALAGALVTLGEVDDTAWLDEAAAVAGGLLDLFSHPEGGFYTTGEDAEALIARPRDVMDNATPSANSLGAGALLRLSALTGESRFEQPAVRALRAVGNLMGEHPTAFGELLWALERYLSPSLEIAVVGGLADPGTAALSREVWGRFLPTAVSVHAPPGLGAEHTPLLADRPLLDGRPTAYVCEHFACRQPVNEPAELGAQIEEAMAARRSAAATTAR
jgi:uncharacterized protein YyaL (SSP411 family)